MVQGEVAQRPVEPRRASRFAARLCQDSTRQCASRRAGLGAGHAQAELAVVANSVPTTATVSRRDAKIAGFLRRRTEVQAHRGHGNELRGQRRTPRDPHEGPLLCARRRRVVRSRSATGPWEVATEVPEEIYTIPPNSPVYYATFARVYQATDDEVEVGYTPGYQGAYEDEGTVVYGTGWNYEPWTGDDYYGWGWTWGYSYVYVPWYQWWVWRPWWNQPGGLRAAQIENIYDRWQGRNGITHYDRAAGTRANAATWKGISGYPALYGRFKGSARPAAMSPPPKTLALNPYSRPPTSVRPARPRAGPNCLTPSGRLRAADAISTRRRTEAFTAGRTTAGPAVRREVAGATVAPAPGIDRTRPTGVGTRGPVPCVGPVTSAHGQTRQASAERRGGETACRTPLRSARTRGCALTPVLCALPGPVCERPTGARPTPAPGPRAAARRRR